MVGLIFHLHNILYFYSFNNTYIQTNSICISVNFSIYCATNSLFIYKKESDENKKEEILKNNRCELFN